MTRDETLRALVALPVYLLTFPLRLLYALVSPMVDGLDYWLSREARGGSE